MPKWNHIIDDVVEASAQVFKKLSALIAARGSKQGASLTTFSIIEKADTKWTKRFQKVFILSN